jgi:membrane protein
MSFRKYFKTGLGIAKETFKAFSEHKVPKLSASLAYSTVFSLGPLLIVIISLCSMFLKKEAVEGNIYNQLSGFLGSDTAQQLQQIIRNSSLQGKSVLAMIIGGVTLLLAATAVFGEIQDSINMIWDVKVKPKGNWLRVLKNRLLSFSLIISLGFLLLVSLAISSIVDVFADRLQERFPETTVVIFYIINIVITFIVTCLIFAVIFKALPDAKIEWKDVWPGAALTTFLFLIGKWLISFYISRANIGSTYGTAGSLVVLLVWVYYSSMLLYLGAAFTRIYASRYGRGVQPLPYSIVEKEGARKLTAT